MTRIALGLEYDGGGYCGWQTQPSGCGVQDQFEAALREIAGVPVATVCAGRTDTGVHALAQVVHFDCAVERPASAWVRGVNALLPPSLAVLWAHEMADTFHARYSATARHYHYVLLNHPVRPALNHGCVGWMHVPLDVLAMQSAATALLGEHDFSSFRSSECQAKSPVRCVTRLNIAAQGAWITFDFSANAFLHHMVRNIVGSLVYVGAGRQPVAWINELLDGRDRKRAAPTFDAAGLYFAGVDYDAHHGLPAFQSRTLLPPGTEMGTPT